MFLPTQPCGKVSADIMAQYTVEQLIGMCIANGGQGGYGYNTYCLDEDGNLISGTIATSTETGRNDPGKLWAHNDGCYNEYGEITYGDDCAYCMWAVGLNGGYDDFKAQVVLETYKLEHGATCGQNQRAATLPSTPAPEEDDLI